MSLQARVLSCTMPGGAEPGMWVSAKWHLGKTCKAQRYLFLCLGETFQPVLPAWPCLCAKCISTQAQWLTGRQLRLGWAGLLRLQCSLLIAPVVELEESVLELLPREKTCLAEVTKKDKVG